MSTTRSDEARPRGSSPSDDRGLVDRVCDVLHALSERPGPHRLADLSQRCELPKPTTYRILMSLCANGSARSTSRGMYDVGPSLHALGAMVLARRPGRPVARRALASLARRTGHSAELGIPSRDGIVCVDRVESEQVYRLGPGVGRSVPLTGSAPGRAVLAALGAQQRAAALVGASTAERRAVRLAGERGWALDDQELTSGVRCIAAPISDETGVIGAISIAGLTFSMTDESLPTYAQMVTTEARAVTRILCAAVSTSAGNHVAG